MMQSSTNHATVSLVQQWIEQCVIDLSLCPFASLPYRAGNVRIVVCSKDSESDFLALLEVELDNLLKDANAAETTLIVGQKVLEDFLDFNDFLTRAEALLAIDARDAHIQMASFHPDYRFAGTDADDAGNYTNRAPFPIVQWLRTESVAKAVSATDTMAIPEKNIAALKSVSSEQLRKLFPWVKPDNNQHR